MNKPEDDPCRYRYYWENGELTSMKPVSDVAMDPFDACHYLQRELELSEKRRLYQQHRADKAEKRFTLSLGLLVIFAGYVFLISWGFL